MSRTIVNAEMEQQRNIDRANKYIDESLKETLGRVGLNAMLRTGSEEGFESPIYGTAEAIGKTITIMGNKIRGLNSDTTKTADAVTFEQAKILDEGIAEAKAILGNGVGSLNTAYRATSQTLFSLRVDESPQVLALLGNDTIMKEMRENYLDFVTNERSASVLNTFNKYGVTGNDAKRKSIDTALNRRHTPGAVERLAGLDKHKERLQSLEQGLTRTHQLLSTNTEKIVGIRSRRFEK